MFLADLLVPASYRAEDVISPMVFAQALFETEKAWVRALARVDRIPSELAEEICEAMGEPSEEDVRFLAEASENGGNPVIDMVKLLRARVKPTLGEDAASAVHTGMTSQDVMDTALMLCARKAFTRVLHSTQAAGNQLANLVAEHATTPMMGRTLAQQAVPTTFGARAGGWLLGLADVLEQLTVEAQQLPASLAGAAGNMATAFAWAPDGEDAATWVLELSQAFADELDLGFDTAGVWHTRRTPIQRATVALADVAVAFGKIANDVIEGARNEVAELAEPAAAGRGGSSAMAHKRNPVLSIMMRRSAVASAQALGNLYEGVALSHEERSAGAWHIEWEPFERLLMHSVVIAELGEELLSGLEVNTERMLANIRLLAADDFAVENINTGIADRLAQQSLEHWHSIIADINENFEEEDSLK